MKTVFKTARCRCNNLLARFPTLLDADAFNKLIAGSRIKKTTAGAA